MSRIRFVALDIEIPAEPSPERKKALTLMRSALTTATTDRTAGGAPRKHKRRPVTLPAVNLKDLDE